MDQGLCLEHLVQRGAPLGDQAEIWKEILSSWWEGQFELPGALHMDMGRGY